MRLRFPSLLIDLLINRFRPLVWVGLLALAPVAEAAVVDPATLNTINTLTVSGRFARTATKPIELTRAELLAHPATHVIDDVAGPRIPKTALTVVPLAALIADLQPTAEADGVVLTCADGWESFVRLADIQRYQHQLLLLFAGKPPSEGGWPWFLKIEPLAPFYVFVPPSREPAYEDRTDYGLTSATQIIGIQAVNEQERYAPFRTKEIEALSPVALQGRALFLRNCNNCHQGPGRVGGNVSERAFSLLQTHARFNADFFRRMVTDPKQFYPKTIMPKHPQFGDTEFAALIAFLSETHAADIH